MAPQQTNLMGTPTGAGHLLFGAASALLVLCCAVLDPLAPAPLAASARPDIESVAAFEEDDDREAVTPRAGSSHARRIMRRRLVTPAPPAPGDSPWPGMVARPCPSPSLAVAPSPSLTLPCPESGLPLRC